MACVPSTPPPIIVAIMVITGHLRGQVGSGRGSVWRAARATVTAHTAARTRARCAHAAALLHLLTSTRTRAICLLCAHALPPHPTFAFLYCNAAWHACVLRMARRATSARTCVCVQCVWFTFGRNDITFSAYEEDRDVGWWNGV